jgi:hypothetical protein
MQTVLLAFVVAGCLGIALTLPDTMRLQLRKPAELRLTPREEPEAREKTELIKEARAGRGVAITTINRESWTSCGKRCGGKKNNYIDGWMDG